MIANKIRDEMNVIQKKKMVTRRTRYDFSHKKRMRIEANII